MKINIKSVVGVGAALLVAFGAAACSSGPATNGNTAEATTSQQDLTTFEQAQPAPHFPYSVYRQNLIKIEASQSLGEATTSFFFQMGDPDPIDSCASIGDPVPNTAELTNPSQVVYRPSSSRDDAGVVIGNIDPDGVYAPPASSGTNVMCVLANGQEQLRYWEGDVYAVNGNATWDSATHRVVTTGSTSMPSCKQQTLKGKSVEVCTK
jgi:hypothetical protein